MSAKAYKKLIITLILKILNSAERTWFIIPEANSFFLIPNSGYLNTHTDVIGII